MKEIKQWRKATEEVTKVFVKKYFSEERYGKDTHWVADRVGDIFCISDYFFNIDLMIEAIEFKATFQQLSDFYYTEVDLGMENKQMPINFVNFIKWGGLENEVVRGLIEKEEKD